MDVRSVRWRALGICAVLLATAIADGDVVSATRRATSAVPLSSCYSSDNGDPWLTGLTVSPSIVEARTRPAKVTISASAMDTGGPGAPSGVGSIEVFVSTGETVSLNQQADGTWRGSLRFPLGSTRGEYGVSSVWVTDRVGLYRIHTGPWLRAQGMATRFTVRSRTDSRGPELQSLSLSSRILDASHGSRSVRLRARVTDDLAGASEVLIVALGGAPSFTEVGRSELTLRRGNRLDGRWTGRLRISGWGGDQNLVFSASLEDRVGNSSYVSAEDLAASGSAPRLTMQGRIDSRRPAIGPVRFNPVTLDLRDPAGAMTFRLRARDSTSGVKSAYIKLKGPDSSGFRRMHRLSGSRSDGIWTFRWAAGSYCWLRPGTYGVTVVVNDAAGRQRRLREAGNFVLTGPDRRRPWVALATPSDLTVTSPLRLTFTEDVTGLSSESAVVRRSGAGRTTTNPVSPGAPGSWACETSAGVSADCFAGVVRTAVWTPAAPLEPSVEYFLDFNPEHVLSLTDLNGNPLNDRGVWVWAPRA